MKDKKKRILKQYKKWIKGGKPRTEKKIPSTDKKVLFFPKHPDRLWGPLSPVFSSYRSFLPKGVTRPLSEVRLSCFYSLVTKYVKVTHTREGNMYSSLKVFYMLYL
jgi:hypothetical protein